MRWKDRPRVVVGGFRELLREKEPETGRERDRDSDRETGTEGE